MKVYLAGPMTGIPQFNFPLFDLVAMLLRQQGLTVVSPAELDDPLDRAAALASPDGSMVNGHGHMKRTWGDFLARDVKLIADEGVEAVAVLPGWSKSRGARLETFVASAMCNLPVYAVTLDQTNLLVGLTPLPSLALFRAWTGDQNLALHPVRWASA